MTRVATIGAFDRFNYGDLLFPITLDAMGVGSGIDFDHFSVRRADMVGFGGVTSGSQRDLVDALSGPSEPAAIVLAGGEVLGATWTQACAAAFRFPIDLGPRMLEWASVPIRYRESWCRKALGGAWSLPYVPPSDVARRTRVVANAVGASSIAGLPRDRANEVLNTMAHAAYVSVRDNRGLGILKAAGVAAELAPDPAAVLRSVFPGGQRVEGKRLVVQCSEAWLRRNRGAVAAIAEAADRFDEVVLLPVGTTGGHNDQIALNRVSSGLTRLGVPVRFSSSRSDMGDDAIGRIVREIEGASVFVGSSLHGAITAMAYGVRHVGLRGVAKLSAYLETWGDGLTPFGVGVSSLSESIGTVMKIDSDLLERRAMGLAELSTRNYERVLSSTGEL